MKPWEILKPCPYCQFMINVPDSKKGDKNYCSNCSKRIVYAVPLGSMDYLWDKPTNFGAMDELIKKQNSGYLG